jgi:hypothetical protein
MNGKHGQHSVRNYAGALLGLTVLACSVQCICRGSASRFDRARPELVEGLRTGLPRQTRAPDHAGASSQQP